MARFAGPAPRPPLWAVEEGGLPLPKDGQSFRAYWRSVGVPDETIAEALVGLTKQHGDLANVRMAGYVRRTCPRAFELYLARRLSVVRSGPSSERSILIADGGDHR